ncbi:hypothetical protein CLOP_g7227 [Closterium sp. NIES-67]|nr:hypothetical protein CLOP_g7227 [Closterium sp. NIES-67]
MIGARRAQWRGKESALRTDRDGPEEKREDGDVLTTGREEELVRSLSQAAAVLDDIDSASASRATAASGGSTGGGRLLSTQTLDLSKLRRGIARPIPDSSSSGTNGSSGSVSPFSTSSISTSASTASSTSLPAATSSTMSLPTPIGITPHWSAYCTDRCGVMWKPIRVYVVWYGYFSEPQKQLVRTLTGSFSPDDNPAVTVPLWWNINRLYYDQEGRFISRNVTWAKEKDDTGYSRGKSLWLTDVEAVIATAIATSELPYDEDGVYFVLSDQYVNQQWSSTDKFCVSFCGWHYFGSAPSRGDFIYSWVGRADKLCPTSCIAADVRTAAKAPNKDPGMDGLLSVYAHELAEAASSPFVSTWFDNDGEENADKCAWNPQSRSGLRAWESLSSGW